MRTGLSFIAILLLIPIYITPGSCMSGRSVAPVHDMTEVWSDFSACELCNTTVRPDGNVELAKSDEYRGLTERALGVGDGSMVGSVAARNSRGQFIVFWANHSDEWNAWVQLYEADWSEYGSTVEVTSYNADLGHLAIGVGPDDRFVVAWSQGIPSASTDLDVFIQCFTPDGSKMGSSYDVTSRGGLRTIRALPSIQGGSSFWCGPTERAIRATSSVRDWTLTAPR